MVVSMSTGGGGGHHDTSWRPSKQTRAAVNSLASLPQETLLNVLCYLGPRDVQRTASTCSALRQAATSDAIWRPIVQRSLRRSPPTQSHNLTTLNDPPPPWDPSFGLISTGRNPATREKWFAPPYGSETLEGADDTSGGTLTTLLSLFDGAQSYHQLYWTFICHFSRLLGWWLGDVPSSGMAIRVVFDPAHTSAFTRNHAQVKGPAFVCQKVHIVNRLYGMARSSASRQAWCEAAGVSSSQVSSDGTSIEMPLLSIDTSVPGVKTEAIWAATWHDCRTMTADQVRNGYKVARIEWKGVSQALQNSNRSETPRYTGSSSSRGLQGQPSIVSRARALASQLVFGPSQAANGDAGQNNGGASATDAIDMEMDDDEETTLPQGGVSLEEIVAASSVDTFLEGEFDDIPNYQRTIRQRNGDKIHTVFLSSGAICTEHVSSFSSSSEATKTIDDGERLSLSVGMYMPYDGADISKTRAFGMKISNFLPLPPIDFPPPAVLPAMRTWGDADDENDEEMQSRSSTESSSPAFEDFLDKGTALTLPAMQMEPCPPYRPWPHLSQPLPSGVRFVPIRSPPARGIVPSSKRVETGDGVKFQHPANLARHLDPASDAFNWTLLNGLYAMTYGPWGQELIYIRSRILTIHDFAPNDPALSNSLAPKTPPETRPTGPHGTGHRLVSAEKYNYDGASFLAEGLHWQPEPYVDVTELELPPSTTSFIRPGCRVLEGVKCTGDANVPRGTVSFRAFSRGPGEDECIAYFPPDNKLARHPPWNGEQQGPHALRTNFDGVEGNDDATDEWHRASQATETLFRMGASRMAATSVARESRRAATHPDQPITGVTPGRILECATGRLAMEGFVNAGIWRRCSVKITSIDELNIHWHALHKISVAKRLMAC